jgi:hypothetical protein
MFRKPADHALEWLSAYCRGNKSAAFYHEIQVRRFISVLRHAAFRRAI